MTWVDKIVGSEDPLTIATNLVSIGAGVMAILGLSGGLIGFLQERKHPTSITRTEAGLRDDDARVAAPLHKTQIFMLAAAGITVGLVVVVLLALAGVFLAISRL